MLHEEHRTDAPASRERRGAAPRPPGRRAIAAAASSMRARARAALWRRVMWSGALHTDDEQGDTDQGREP
jgi:hypothetical protein